MEYRKETEAYWNDSAENYSTNIRQELIDEQELWIDLILKNAPKQDRLRILDIGCGPGFFTIIMTKAGHDVTGIDVTPNMLAEARENARSQGLDPEFRQMDVHHLEYPDNTFDLLVSRNVTWTLFEPEQAYKEWKRVLKPGGRLLIFDGNWYMQIFKSEAYETLRNGIRTYCSRHGQLPKGFRMNKREDYWLELPMVGRERPLWDRAQLWKLAFDEIVSEDITTLVNRTDREILLYGCVPMFMVRGTKMDPEQEKHWLSRVYWNGFAPFEGVEALAQFARGTSAPGYRKIREQLPPAPASVLDIGCGGGGNALLMTREGYQVTGVDFAGEMVEEAAYAAKQAGLSVQFQTAEADDLPFASASFDAVLVSRMGQEHFDREKAEKEWKRVLKPEGTLIVCD